MYIEQMLKESKARGVKAAIFLGDLGPHSNNLQLNQTIPESQRREVYYNMKTFLYNMSKQYFKRFNEIMPIFMNIGNHDTLVNYETPDVQGDYLQNDFLQFLQKVYLEGSDSLAMGRYDKDKYSQAYSVEDNRSLFTEIGCYAVKDIFQTDEDTNGYISLISLNSMLYSKKTRDKNLNKAELGLRWLEEVLKSAPLNEKFILTQHYFPDTHYETPEKLQWKDEYRLEFERILKEYSDKILLSLSGHLHSFNMPKPLVVIDDEHPTVHFTMGAFSPILNEPVYYFVKFTTEDKKVCFNDILINQITLKELITVETSIKQTSRRDLADPEDEHIICKSTD